MTPDLYAAWLTAGTNLQPAGAWIARNSINLTAAAALATFAWRSIRRAARRVDQILADEQPETNTQSRREDR